MSEDTNKPESKYLKNVNTGLITYSTSSLRKKSYMVPCDGKGNLIAAGGKKVVIVEADIPATETETEKTVRKTAPAKAPKNPKAPAKKKAKKEEAEEPASGEE